MIGSWTNLVIAKKHYNILSFFLSNKIGSCSYALSLSRRRETVVSKSLAREQTKDEQKRKNLRRIKNPHFYLKVVCRPLETGANHLKKTKFV